MSPARPTPEEERFVEVGRRAASWEAGRLVDGEQYAKIRERVATGWRGWSARVRVALFVLASIGVISLAGFLYLLKFPGAPWVAAGIAFAVAEMLVRTRRWFHAGVEEALWLGGALLVVFEIEPSGDAVFLFVAAAFLLAGFRVMNWLFVVSGVLILMSWVAEVATSVDAAFLCLVLSIPVAFGSLIRFDRPFHDASFRWATIALPFCGYLFARFGSFGGSGIGPAILAALIATAVVQLAIGIARRAQASLRSAILLGALVSYELAERVVLPNSVKLIAGGGLAFALALLIERFLREPRRGWTAKRLEASSGFDGLEIAAAAQANVLVQQEAAAQSGQAGPEPEGGGGSFGGGGASGSY